MSASRRRRSARSGPLNSLAGAFTLIANAERSADGHNHARSRLGVDGRRVSSDGIDVLGDEEVSRLVPYSSAHLLEEAVEGKYAAQKDPIFVLGLITRDLVPFAVALLLASRYHSRAPLIVGVLGLCGLFWIHGDTLRAPPTIRNGFLLEIVVVGVTMAGTIGILRSRRGPHGKQSRDRA